jgi:small subunit ribosomal protein S13
LPIANCPLPIPTWRKKQKRKNMARIAGVDLPKNKRGEIGLTYIFGIGPSTARYILDKNNISRDKKVNDWNDEDLNAIRNTITDEFKVEGQLRSEVQMSIKRLLDIACYRGMRHRKGLPVRGQRTRTNSRTRKGKRKTVAGKKKAPKK